VTPAQFVDISEDDILEAMKHIRGYLDITPGDFREVYGFAYQHAYERLTRGVKARDVLTREVVTVRKDTPLTEVADSMALRGISGVPVLDADDRVAGIISEKDFLFRMGTKETRSFMSIVARCLRNRGCVALPLQEQKAEDIMTSPAVTVREDTPVSEIATLFKEKTINRVPITDETGRIVGIVSRADIIKPPLIAEKDRS
jgi:CBS domain-containing protein